MTVTVTVKVCAVLFFDRDFFAGDGDGFAFPGASVGVCALSADGETATVPQSAIAAEIGETLDGEGAFAAEVAFHGVVLVYGFADAEHFGVVEFVYAPRLADVGALADFGGFGVADAVDVCESDEDSFFCGEVDAGDASHWSVLLLVGRGFVVWKAHTGIARETGLSRGFRHPLCGSMGFLVMFVKPLFSGEIWLGS